MGQRTITNYTRLGQWGRAVALLYFIHLPRAAYLSFRKNFHIYAVKGGHR